MKKLILTKMTEISTFAPLRIHGLRLFHLPIFPLKTNNCSIQAICMLFVFKDLTNRNHKAIYTFQLLLTAPSNKTLFSD